MATTSRMKNKNSKKSGLAGKTNLTKGRVKEILFDPEARRDHLRGFSERKRQRRAYGLAMQKVKDRNGKLEARRERTRAMQEQVEEAERQKEEMMNELLKQTMSEDDDQTINDKSLPADEETTKPPSVTEYKDEATLDQWGGNVLVTTSTHIPDDDDDNTSMANPPAKRQKGTDSAQEHAGKVERYLHALKGSMPARKKSTNSQKKQRGGTGVKGESSALHPKIQYSQQHGAKSKGKDTRTRRTGSRK